MSNPYEATGLTSEIPDSGVSPGMSGLASPSFTGFVLTQFLGAFNDNYFKQMVLLSCITQMAVDQTDRQPLALAAFALPFVLLSGFGGFLSDRYSKQRVIVLCKVGEIAVMALSLIVLLIPGISSSSQLLLLIVVLSFMGGQSALFGPSKYGALPELYYPERLILANGIVQMTTFLAIIFGVVCAGFAMDILNRNLWTGSVLAVGIAAAGTVTAFLIPPTPARMPNLTLNWDNLFLPKDVRQLLRDRRDLLMAILVATMFWFIGGVTQPAVNILGREVMGLSDTRASILTAGIGIGIAVGCIAVGILAKNSGDVWVMRGAWGVVAALFLIGVLASFAGKPMAKTPTGESILQCLFSASALEWALRFAMMSLGVAAGIFVVPIQTFLQQSPPADQKGRVIGVQNLFSWIGILVSAVFLEINNRMLSLLFGSAAAIQRQFIVFIVLAAFMLPVAVWYRLNKSVGMTENI